MTKQQITIKVFERYPVKDKELTCLDFKQRQYGKREAYRKRLMNEYGLNDIKKTRIR